MAPFGLGVIGNDRRARALRERLQPGNPFAYGDFRLARADNSERWPDVLADRAVDAVYLGCPPADRAEVVVAALGAGKAVLATLPLAETSASLAAIAAATAASPAPLLITTDLRSTLAGRAVLELVRAGDLGRLFSIYLASRWSRSGGEVEGQADLMERLWEAVDFVQALAGNGPQRLFAVQGREVAGASAVLFNARFAGGLIATAEVGALLPARAPVPDPEVELEIAGVAGAVRCEPHRHAVLVAGDGGRTHEPGAPVRDWHVDPVIGMLADLGSLLQGGDAPCGIDLSHLGAVLASVEALEDSLLSGAAMRLGAAEA